MTLSRPSNMLSSRSLTRRLSRSLTRRLSRSLTRRLSRSLTRRLSRSLTRRLSRSLTRRLSRSLTRRLSRSLTRYRHAFVIPISAERFVDGSDTSRPFDGRVREHVERLKERYRTELVANANPAEIFGQFNNYIKPTGNPLKSRCTWKCPTGNIE